ncbi:MAG: hypothetical protein P4L03_01370 [Terracidiphilus sp.]|nr:hypothetical protein [Terracidiphilus sp.]
MFAENNRLAIYARMRKLVQSSLILLLVSSITWIGFIIRFILLGSAGKEAWGTATGLLAVITAVVAAWPAIRTLEIQEDTLRPRPTPFFDVSSRHNLLQLRVKNFGGAVAYDVRIEWKGRPVDHMGDAIKALDEITVLLPQESVSTLVGGSLDMVRKLSMSRFEGTCRFKDASGKHYRDRFICSVDGFQRQQTFDNELPKTLHDLQKVPDGLSKIAERLEKLEKKS